MSKVSKLISIINNCDQLFGMPKTEAFSQLLVCNLGTPTEYYIDPRTYRDENNLYVVKPITGNRLFFCYVCPFCQEIHIETCRALNVKHKKLYCKCKHIQSIGLQFILDAPIALISKEPYEVYNYYDEIVWNNKIRREWEYMQKFEASED